MSARAIDQVRDDLMFCTAAEILKKYGCDRDEIVKWLNGELTTNPVTFNMK